MKLNPQNKLVRWLKYLFVFLFLKGLGQHYQFSQFYAAQLYLNPAFTGANSCTRFSLNYRNQWSQIPGTFTSYQVSLDKSLKKYNSGVGLGFFSDKAGLGSLKTNQFNLMYAYELKINKDLVARAGVSTGFTQRSVDYSLLRFGDQIARGGASSSVEGLSDTRIMYFDLNAGYLMYGRNYWGGFSVNHIAQPNQSLTGDDSPLPREYKVHGGYKYFLGEETSKSKEQHAVTAAINYKRQQKFNQIDVGAYYSKGYFAFGIWYRGIPLYRPQDWYRNNDALIFLFGISTDKVQIGYSFDYTLNKLMLNNTRGTHEISMTYLLCSAKKKKKKLILVSCPKF